MRVELVDELGEHIFAARLEDFGNRDIVMRIEIEIPPASQGVAYPKVTRAAIPRQFILIGAILRSPFAFP